MHEQNLAFKLNITNSLGGNLPVNRTNDTKF